MRNVGVLNAVILFGRIASWEGETTETEREKKKVQNGGWEKERFEIYWKAGLTFKWRGGKKNESEKRNKER